MVAKVGWLWQFLKNKNGESCPHGLTLSFIEHLEATIGLLTGLSFISVRPVNREPGERAVGSDWMVEQSKHKNVYQSRSSSYAGSPCAETIIRT